LVIVSLLERLHPRHWDGQRFLRFLTGLALIALAFAAPVAPAAAATPAPPAVITTTVEAPAAAKPAAAAAEQPAAAAQPAAAVEEPAAVETCRHDASGYRGVTPPADTAAAVTGVGQRAHGTRGPPRA
jgi:hypothetical protein